MNQKGIVMNLIHSIIRFLFFLKILSENILWENGTCFYILRIENLLIKIFSNVF